MRMLVVAVMLLLANPISADTGFASYYAHFHHGKKMANGKPFNMWAMTAAHKRFKLGTKLKVCYKKKCAIVTVTDRGPYIGHRVLDLSLAAARKLGTLKKGVALVTFTKI